MAALAREALLPLQRKIDKKGDQKMTGKVAKKVVGTLLSRTLWLARGTSMVMGLAVMLALVVGLASTALAGTGVGAHF